MVPRALQRGHGPAVTIWPRIDWRTRRTWPAPPQSGQVWASAPGAAPEPSQSSHVMAVRTLTGAWVPNTASSNDEVDGGLDVGARRRAARRTAAAEAAAAEEGLEDVAEAAAAERAAAAPVGPSPSSPTMS